MLNAINTTFEMSMIYSRFKTDLVIKMDTMLKLLFLANFTETSKFHRERQ